MWTGRGRPDKPHEFHVRKRFCKYILKGKFIINTGEEPDNPEKLKFQNVNGGLIFMENVRLNCGGDIHPSEKRQGG